MALPSTVRKKQKSRKRQPQEATHRIPIPDFSAEEDFPTLSHASTRSLTNTKAAASGKAEPESESEAGPRFAATSASDFDTESSVKVFHAQSDADVPPLRKSRHPKKSKTVLLADLFDQLGPWGTGRCAVRVTNSRRVDSKAMTTKIALHHLSIILKQIINAPHNQQLRTIPCHNSKVQAIEAFPQVYQIFLRCGFRKVPAEERTQYVMLEDSVAQLPQWLSVVELQSEASKKMTNMASDPLLHGMRGKERRTKKKKRITKLKKVVLGAREERQSEVLRLVRDAITHCEPHLPLPSFQLFDVKCALRAGAVSRPNECVLSKDTPALEVLALLDKQLSLLSSCGTDKSPVATNLAEEHSTDDATASALSSNDSVLSDSHPTLVVLMCDLEVQTEPILMHSEGTDAIVPCLPCYSQATQTVCHTLRDAAVGADRTWHHRRARGAGRDVGMGTEDPPPLRLEVQCAADLDDHTTPSQISELGGNRTLEHPSTSNIIVQTEEVTRTTNTCCQTDSVLSQHMTQAYGLHPLQRFLDQRVQNCQLPPANRPPIREYCRAVLTDDVDTTAREMLELLAKFQKRTLRDPMRRRHKRYVVGLRQTAKGLAAKRCRMVLLAPNIEKAGTDGGLDSLISRIMALGESQQVPVVFCMQRRKLGSVLGIVHGVSAVGIYSTDGAHAQYKQLCALSEGTWSEYHRVVVQQEALRREAERAQQVAAAKVAAREAAKLERMRAHEEAQVQARQAKLERATARREAAAAREREKSAAKAHAAASKAAHPVRCNRPFPPHTAASAGAPTPLWSDSSPTPPLTRLNPHAMPWYPHAYSHCGPPAFVYYQ